MTITTARATEVARLLDRLAGLLPDTDPDRWQAASMAQALRDQKPPIVHGAEPRSPTRN